jgi:hypothetical protein
LCDSHEPSSLHADKRRKLGPSELIFLHPTDSLNGYLFAKFQGIVENIDEVTSDQKLEKCEMSKTLFT